MQLSLKRNKQADMKKNICKSVFIYHCLLCMLDDSDFANTRTYVTNK